MKCEICDNALMCRWTDTHGIGACVICGATYRLFFYENDKRVEKAPESLTLPEWKPIIKRYWNEKHRNCSPGLFNFPGSSYEVASREDFESFNEWMNAHEAELPKTQEAKP